MAEPEDSELLQKYHNTDRSSSTGGPVIIAMGVGGGGGNAVDYMCSQDIRGVEFIALNTDLQALRLCHAPTQVLLGPKLCGGLGAGGRPEVGAAAAEESVPEIERLVDRHVDMVFITAGMGGGTGTGAAPIVAEAAKEMGILTVGVVTKPFWFEGRRRMQQAESGIEELQSKVDSLVVIPNDRIKHVTDQKITFANGFQISDDVLRQALLSITELIGKAGFINLDFADVTTIMKGAGLAHMGVGTAAGKDKAEEAARQAIASPLLETSINGAKGVLVSITGSMDISMDDVEAAAAMVQEAVHPDANTIFGAAFDEKMEDEIRVTIIATGFDEKKGAGAITVSGGGAAGGSSKEKFNDLLLRPQTEEEKKAEEKDPFEDILRIFDR